MKRDKRQRIIVRKTLQFKYASVVFFAMLITAVTVGADFYYSFYGFVGEYLEEIPGIDQLLSNMNQLLYAKIVVLLIIAVAASILVSHKFVGPGRQPAGQKVVGFLLIAGLIGFAGWLYREWHLTNKNEEKPAGKSGRNTYVHITGEINDPGLYRVGLGTRLGELVETAGGLTADADISGINLALKVRDGQKIVIPAKKNFFKKIGIGKGPPERYIIPPIEVKKAE